MDLAFDNDERGDLRQEINVDVKESVRLMRASLKEADRLISEANAEWSMDDADIQAV